MPTLTVPVTYFPPKVVPAFHRYRPNPDPRIVKILAKKVRTPMDDPTLDSLQQKMAPLPTTPTTITPQMQEHAWYKSTRLQKRLADIERTKISASLSDHRDAANYVIDYAHQYPEDSEWAYQAITRHAMLRHAESFHGQTPSPWPQHLLPHIQAYAQENPKLLRYLGDIPEVKKEDIASRNPNWTRTSGQTHTRVGSPSSTPKTMADVRLAPYTSMPNISSSWDTERAREIQHKMDMMDAITATMGGQHPMQAVMHLPEVHAALINGELPLTTLTQMTGIVDRLTERKVNQKAGFSELDQLVRPQDRHTGSEIVDFSGEETRAQRFAAMDAAHETIQQFMQTMADKAGVPLSQVESILGKFSDQQHAFITSDAPSKAAVGVPGGGKSTTLAGDLVHKYQQGEKVDEFKYISPTRASAHALITKVQQTQALMPGFDTSKIKAQTPWSLGMSLLNKRNVPQGSTLVSPLEAMDSGKYAKYRPMGGATSSTKKLEDIENSLEDGEVTYIKKLLTQYKVKGMDAGELAKSFSTTKNNRSLTNDYKTRLDQGAKLYNQEKETGLTSPDALFYAYVQSTNMREGFKVPGQTTPVYDRSDTLHFTHKAAKQGYIAPLKGVVADEFQDMPAEGVAMIAAITSPASHVSWGGDMSQKTFDNMDRVDAFVRRGMKPTRRHEQFNLTGDFRTKNPWNAAAANARSASPHLQGRPRSNYMVSVGSRTAWGQMPTFHHEQTFQELYQGELTRWFGQMQLSMKQVYQNMQQGLAPLHGAAMTPQESPFIFATGGHRDEFAQNLQAYLAQHLGSTVGNDAYNQIYTNQTPTGASAQKLHALTMSQVRGREFDAPISYIGRAGKWDEGGFENQQFTMNSRASGEEGQRFISAGQNIGTPYSTIPDYSPTGRPLPPGSMPFIQRMIDNAMQQQGLPIEAIPEEFASMARSPFVADVQEPLSQNSTVLRSMVDFFKTVITNHFYQPGVGDMPVIAPEGSMEKEYDAEAGEAGKAIDYGKTWALTPAGVSGDIEHKPDMARIAHARRQLQLMAEAGPQALEFIRTLNGQQTTDYDQIPTAEDLLSSKTSPFSHYEDEVQLPFMTGMDTLYRVSQLHPFGVATYGKPSMHDPFVNPEELVNSTVIEDAGKFMDQTGGNFRPALDSDGGLRDKSVKQRDKIRDLASQIKIHQSLIATYQKQFDRAHAMKRPDRADALYVQVQPVHQQLLALQEKHQQALAKNEEIEQAIAGVRALPGQGISLISKNISDTESTFDEKNKKFEQSVASEVPPDFFRDPKKQRAFDLRHRAMTSLLQDPAIVKQFIGTSLYAPTATTLKGSRKLYKKRGVISHSSIQQFLQETNIKRIQKGMDVLLRHPGFKQQVNDRMKELDEQPGGNLPHNDDQKAKQNLFNLVQMDAFGQHPAGQELLRQQYNHPRIQRFVNSRLQKNGGSVPDYTYRGLMDQAETLRAQGDLKGAASLEAQAKHILGGKASFYDKQVAALVASSPTQEFGEHIQAEAQEQLVQKALSHPELLRSVLGVTHSLINDHALSYPEYLQTRSSLLNIRAYRDTLEQGVKPPVVMTGQMRRELAYDDPMQAHLFETIIKQQKGDIALESDPIQHLISARAHTPALAQRLVGTQGEKLGITPAMSRISPFVTEVQNYAQRLAQGGIVDPMAGIMKGGAFHPLGAAVGLRGYQTRLEEMLARGGFEHSDAEEGMRSHLAQVQALRGVLDDSSMQEQLGHYLHLASRVSTGMGAFDPNVTEEQRKEALAQGKPIEEPIDRFFAPQRNQFGEGQRSLEGVMSYVSAAMQGMEHVQRTGTMKRGHINALLGAMGHDTNSTMFAGLRHFEKQGRFAGPEDTLSLDDLLNESTKDRLKRAEEYTRYPIHPGEPVVFTGTPMGPQQQGTEPGTQGTLLPAPNIPYHTLNAFVKGASYDYQDYPTQRFGSPSDVGNAAHPFYGLLSQGQQDALRANHKRDLFKVPVEPMYLMQQVGAQGFTTQMPVLASQVMPESIYNRLQGGESFGSLHPSSRVVEADPGSGPLADIPQLPKETQAPASLEALASLVRTQPKKERVKKQYNPITSLGDLPETPTTIPEVVQHQEQRQQAMRLTHLGKSFQFQPHLQIKPKTERSQLLALKNVLAATRKKYTRAQRPVQRATRTLADAAPAPAQRLLPQFAESRQASVWRGVRADMHQYRGKTILPPGTTPIPLPAAPLIGYSAYEEKRMVRGGRQERNKLQQRQVNYTPSLQEAQARRQYRADQYARIQQHRTPTSLPEAQTGQSGFSFVPPIAHNPTPITKEEFDQISSSDFFQRFASPKPPSYAHVSPEFRRDALPLMGAGQTPPPPNVPPVSSFQMPEGDDLHLLAHQANVMMRSMADFGPIPKQILSSSTGPIPNAPHAASEEPEDLRTPPPTEDVMANIRQWNRQGNMALKPPIYPPSDEQLGVLDDASHHKIIEGGPGGGKTATVDRAIMDLIASGEVKPNQVKLVSAMHSGTEALNQGFDPYRALLPKGHEYQLNAAQTFHSIANEILTPQIMHDLGVGHLAGMNILEEPNEDERDTMSPAVWQDKLQHAPSTHYREFMRQRGIHVSQEQAISDLGDINRIKNQRGTPDSAYEAMMLQGRATLAAGGPMIPEAKLAVYEQGMHAEGNIDYSDQPYYALRALNELGPRVLSKNLLNTRVFGLDEAQDITTLNASMFQKTLSHMQDMGLNPRVFVGMDRMQSLMQGLGGIDKEQVQGAFQHMLGTNRVHQLTRNFRSDAGTVALNNAILQHPDLVGTAMSPQQVPVNPHIGKSIDFTGLAQSQPTLYRNMFRSMIKTAGISLGNVATNLAQGHHALEGMTWPEQGSHRIPSQVPAILSSRQQQRLFKNVAHQELEGAGLSPRDAHRAYQQLFRNRLPGRLTTTADRERAKTQFPVIRTAGSRSLEFQEPHADVTRVGGWIGNAKDLHKKRDYLSNVFTMNSRTAQGGQLHVFAASHPFRKDQQDYYEQNPQSLDDSVPGIVRLAGGPQGGRVLASPLNAFEEMHKDNALLPIRNEHDAMAIPAEFKGIMQRQQAQIDDWQGNGLLPSQVVNSTLASSPMTHAPGKKGTPASLPTHSPNSATQSSAPPPRVTHPQSASSVTIQTPSVQVNLPPGGQVSVNGGPSPVPSVPNAVSPVTAVPAGTGSTVGTPPLAVGQPIGAMIGRARPGSTGMTPYSGNAGMATQVGNGQPPTHTPGGGSFGKFSNDESNIGHSLARIGGELQYLGQLGGSIIDATIKQGSDYRKATVPLGSSVSGTNGTQGFFDFSASGGINSYSHNTLPMYSNTRVAQGIQDLTGMTNTPFSQQGTLPAFTDIMGLSAMTGISSQQLMGQMTGIQGTLGGNVLGGIPNMTGMLSGLYGSNLTEGNVSPTLSALQRALPTVQGLQPGGSGGMAQVMAFYKLALQSGMTSNNLGGVSDLLGSLSGMGNTPNLQQQYSLGQLFGNQNLTGATDLAQYQSQQTSESQALAVNRLQQNIGGGLSLPNLQIKISQANIQMQQAQLTMSEAQLQASTVQQQQSQLQQNYNVANFSEQQSIQNAQYGPIGMDSSKTAYFSWLRSKNAAQYNGTSPEIATQFQSAPTFGLQNAQFYAGLEHQRTQMVLSRSPLLSDMAFQENNKYINQQEAFYQAQLKLTNQQRSFELDWQPKLLAGNQKVLDVQKSLLGIQAQELGVQQDQFVLAQKMAVYEQKSDAITQQYLKQQGDDLANLMVQQHGQLIGLGPVSGKNVQPDQIIQALAKESPTNLKQTINRMGLPTDQQQTLMLLVQQLQKGGSMASIEKQLSGKGDKALQANLQKLIKSGAFSDAQTSAATSNAALNYGGTGAQWDALTKTLAISNKSLEVLASTFAPSSSFVLAIEKLANVLGPLAMAVASIFNIIGLLKAVGGGGNIVGNVGKGIGALSGTTLGGLGISAAGIGATIWGGVQGWGDFGHGVNLGGALKNVLLPGYNFGNDAHRTLQDFQNVPAEKAKNDQQWVQLEATMGKDWQQNITPFFQKSLPAWIGGMGKAWNNSVGVFFTKTMPTWWAGTEWPYLQKTIGLTFSQLGTLFHDQIPALFNNILDWFTKTAGPWWSTHIDGFFNTLGTNITGFFKSIPHDLSTMMANFMKKEFSGNGKSGSNPLSAFLNLLSNNSGGAHGEAGPSVISHGGFITPTVNADFHQKMNYGIHQGVDFAASQGTPLEAFDGGKVTGSGFYPWGGEIDVDIGGGLTERYLHLSQLGAHIGQVVKRGQRLGLTGGGTPASGLGYWSSGAHSHVQIDQGDINAGLNPWAIWAMLGDSNISQYYNGSGVLASGNPVTSRQLLHAGGARLSSSQRMHHLSEGGIAMTRMRTELAESGPEAVVPLSKLASVLNTNKTGSQVPLSSSSKSISITKIADRLEVHVHTTAQTLDERAQDDLMAQLLTIFTAAIQEVDGKLT